MRSGQLGALADLELLAKTLLPPENRADPHLLVPAQILLAVSAFRCLFRSQYEGNVVFHGTPLSSWKRLGEGTRHSAPTGLPLSATGRAVSPTPVPC